MLHMSMQVSITSQGQDKQLRRYASVISQYAALCQTQHCGLEFKGRVSLPGWRASVHTCVLFPKLPPEQRLGQPGFKLPLHCALHRARPKHGVVPLCLHSTRPI